MKEKLTDEFLETLVELACIIGWDANFTETIFFVEEAYAAAGKKMPKETYDKLYGILS